ncbi:MAG: FUSC family protein [Alphaproteobacteria bacterium]|jgi:uncharacterized membrane protein YccC|nr:FUSC family protein [Alphaproteobacteria bacterium]
MTLDPALRLGLQAALAVAAALGLAEFGFTERPLWVAVTAMLIICGSFGENLVRGTERALGTLAGVVAAHFVWMMVAPRPEIQLVAVAVAMFGFLATLGGTYRWPVFWATVMILVLLHYLQPDARIEVERLVDTLIGAGIGTISSLILLPMRVSTRAEAEFRAVLDLVEQHLQAVIGNLARGEATAADMAGLADAHERLDALLPLVPAVAFEARLGLGARGDLPRRLEALRLALCFLHALADALPQAAATGLGARVAMPLAAIANRIAENVACLRRGSGALKHLAELRAGLYRELDPVRAEGAEARRDLLRFTAVVFHITQVNRAFLEIGVAFGLAIEIPDQEAVRAPA